MAWTQLSNFLEHLKKSHAIIGNEALKLANRSQPKKSRKKKNHGNTSQLCSDAKAPSSKKILGTIGICALDSKARSKRSRHIMTRLQSTGDFETLMFGDKVIFDEGMA